VETGNENTPILYDPSFSNPSSETPVDSSLLNMNDTSPTPADNFDDDTLPDVHSSDDNVELIMEQRKKLNIAAFGTTFESGAISKQQAKNNRILSMEEYDHHINVLRYWNIEEGHTDPHTGEHVTQEEYR
jgi:hypothetical protein